jgi:hypothetical protein
MKEISYSFTKMDRPRRVYMTWIQNSFLLLSKSKKIKLFSIDNLKSDSIVSKDIANEFPSWIDELTQVNVFNVFRISFMVE